MKIEYIKPLGSYWVGLIALFFLIALMSGCSTVAIQGARGNSVQVEAIPTTTSIKEIDLYSIEIGPEPSTPVFFVTGSGCASLSYYMQSYFTGLAGSWKVYAVQKIGVNNRDLGLLCNKTFYDHYDFETLLRQNQFGIDEVIRRYGYISGLIGVSEGGQVAAELMASTKTACSLVVIGSGGLPFRAVGELMDSRHKGLTFAKAFSDVESDPSST